MKLLFYNHTGQVSGAERVLLQILSQGKGGHFMPVVVCPTQGPLARLVADLDLRCESVDQLQARFTCRPDRLVRYLISFARVIRQVRACVNKVQPDLVHANAIRAGLVISAATIGTGVPIIWHVHDLLPRHPFSPGIRLFALSSSRTRILAVSQIVAENFRGNLLRWFKGRVRVAVVRNAVDLNRFHSDPVTRGSSRKELGLSHADQVVGIIGQLTPRKGQLELIRVFKEVALRNPAAVLLVVGAPIFNRDAHYEQKLKETAADLGIANRIRFLGQRNDVDKIILALDLLVLNSKAEAFPLAAIEGMASGTPVIATNVGGVPELIAHGETGWLIRPGDRVALANAIVELLRDPALRARIANNGQQLVSLSFSQERFRSEFDTFCAWAVRRDAPAEIGYRSIITSVATPQRES